MREDMDKVIVERPRMRRPRRGQGSPYPRTKLANIFDRELEDAPSKLGMSVRHGDKWLNENLAPLARYLRSQVGRPWDRVKSEISARIRPTTAVQAHVLQHVDDFVTENVTMVDGKPHERVYGQLRPVVVVRGCTSLWVCPRSGILREAPRARVAKPIFGRTVRLDGKNELREIAGRWMHVTLSELNVAKPERAFDVLLEQRLSLDWFDHRERFRKLFGRTDAFAIAVRELGLRELERAAEASKKKPKKPRRRKRRVISGAPVAGCAQARSQVRKP